MFLENLFCCTLKMINSSLNNQDKHTIIIDNLIYMLCGIDTSYLSIGMKNKKYTNILEGDYPIEYLKPFEEICINVRIVHKFIFKNISSKESTKKSISEFLLKNKKNYLLKIGQLKIAPDIETLYVSIQEDINLFREFRFIIDACRTSDESEIYNKISFIIEKPYYKELYDVLQRQSNRDIFDWIIKGEISSSCLVGERIINPEDIEEGYWKSKYFIKRTNTSENIDILNCGKLTNLVKSLDQDFEVNLTPEFIIQRGITGTLVYLKDMTYSLLCKELNYEISVLEKYIFMNDMSFFSDLFTDLYNDKSFNISNDFSVHSEENKKFIRKVNLFRKFDIISFTMTELDLNNTIYTILNTELQIKNNQSILEFLTIKFNPRILKLILTKKNFLEFELIFRVLFTLSVIQFFLQKTFNFRFSKLVLCFIENFKFSIFSDIKSIVFKDVESTVNDINSTIMQYLNNLFLVSSDIYLIISEIIDLSFNFISLDKKEECINIEEFETKFVDIISHLYSKVRNVNCDWWFLNTLECLMDEKYFKR